VCLYRSKSLAGIGLLAFSLSSCVKYHPKPLDPSQLETAYRSRSLTDKGLQSFLKTLGPGLQASQLDLQTLTWVALYYHSDVTVAQSHLRAAEAAIVTAGAKPNPVLDGGAGYNNSDRSRYVFTFAPQFLIETAGKRKYRILAAQKEAEAARIALDETAWQVRSRLRTALVDYFSSLRDVEALRSQESLRAEALRLTERRLSVGEGSRPEVSAAQSALSTLRLVIEEASGRVAQARASLAAATGLPLAALDNREIVWKDYAQVPPAAELSLSKAQRAGLLNRVDLRRLLLEYAAADANLRLEVARQYPNITLVPTYAFEDGLSRYVLDGSLTLPIRNRHQGPIAEAEARREELAARFLALQASVIGDLERELEHYRAALAELREAETRLVTVERSRENATGRAFEVGEADKLQLTAAQLARLQAEHSRLDALRKAQMAWGALQDAMQQPLEPDPALPSLSAVAPRKEVQP